MFFEENVPKVASLQLGYRRKCFSGLNALEAEKAKNAKNAKNTKNAKNAQSPKCFAKRPSPKGWGGDVPPSGGFQYPDPP